MGLPTILPSNGSFLPSPTQHISECSEDESDCEGYKPYPERPETYIVPFIFSIIFVVGVVGNGTLIVIFLRHRAMRNIPNTYIFSLALADLLVIIICVPLASLIYTLDSWPWGSALCRITECAKDISIGVSVFTLTALSADRYCAIVNPLRKLQTKPLTVLTALLIWVLAIVCATPAAIMSEAVTVVLNNTTNQTIITCTPFGQEGLTSKTYAQYNVVAKSIAYYFLPLSIIGILYALMARRLHLSTREVPGDGPCVAGPQRAQARARRHVARMVVTFVIVFIICFLPYHVYMLWFHLNPNSEQDYDTFWHITKIAGFSLSFLNSCINPVALYCVSGVFRQHFHRYLCCKQIQQTHHRLGMSMATNACDTSFMSTIRRTQHGNHHTIVHNGTSPTQSACVKLLS